VVPLIIILIIAIVVLTQAIKIVPPDHIYIRTRLGQLQGPMKPGLNFVAPFIDTVAARYPRTKTVTLSGTFVSSDKENVAVELEARYSILDAVKAFRNIPDIDQAVRTLLETVVRNEAARRKGDDFRFERQSMEADVMRAFNDAGAQFGVQLTEVTSGSRTRF